MPRTALRHAIALIGVLLTLLVDVVTGATPAAAHSVGGGSLPAPSWLLGYIGAFAVVLTGVGLRAAWSTSRWAETDTDGDAIPVGLAAETHPGPPTGVGVGHVLGLAALVGIIYTALAGPDSAAANIAPVAVLVIWWVGLPAVCLLAGDVVRVINPFVPVVAALERLRGAADRPSDRRAPTWTGAAFLAAFSWFFLCYHRPGSPRALAVFLLVYSLAAVAGGLRWGRGWVSTGEGFAALSRAVSLVSLRRRDPAPPGLLPLVVVWLGGTAFDAIASTDLWLDVQGTSQGWTRTMLSSVGFVWMTAIVAGVVLLVLRFGQQRSRVPADDESDDAAEASALAASLGVALVPVALVWFLAHDLTFFLFESQNFYALASDPLGKGWDLFGTIGHTIDYTIHRGTWVRWVQLLALLAGHVAAVALAHDAALVLLGRRRGMRMTWAVTVAIALSIVAAALLVLT